MPTEHKKTKSKATANVEIKVEAQDLHPLNHYIDDRVELIRQIFMSLKSKQIKSIAPDFLQVNYNLLMVKFQFRGVIEYCSG